VSKTVNPERAAIREKPASKERAVKNEETGSTERPSAAQMLYGENRMHLRTVESIDRALRKLEEEHKREILKAQTIKRFKTDSDWFSVREIYNAARRLLQPFSVIELARALKINMRAPCPELLNLNGRMAYIVQRGFFADAGTRPSSVHGKHRKTKLYRVTSLESLPRVVELRERYEQRKAELEQRRSQLENAKLALRKITEVWHPASMMPHQHIRMLEMYVEGKTLDAIGRKFKVSRQWVQKVLEGLVV